MKTVETYGASIFLGLRGGYTNNVSTIKEVNRIVGEYVDEHNMCVSVTPTAFHYVGGDEPGAIIGLINYPRYPSTKECLKSYALAMATHLKETFHQNRVSVMFPDETIMIGDE